MLPDFEKAILGNPVLGAICIWEFIRKFETHRTPVEHPSLLHLLPVMPIILRRQSCEALKTMQFGSGLAKFLANDPTLIVDLQERIAAWSDSTLRSINIGCASGLFVASAQNGELQLKSIAKTLPVEIQPEGTAQEKTLASRRLGAFFAMKPCTNYKPS